MAVESKDKHAIEKKAVKKKWRIDKAVFITWLVVLALTAIFWYLILKLV